MANGTKTTTVTDWLPTLIKSGILIGLAIWLAVTLTNGTSLKKELPAMEKLISSTEQPTPEREERVSVKDFAPGESFRKVVQSTGLDWEVMNGCLTVESVSSRNPRMLETVCAGAPKQLRPSAAYIDFRAEAGPATLRMVE